MFTVYDSVAANRMRSPNEILGDDERGLPT